MSATTAPAGTAAAVKTDPVSTYLDERVGIYKGAKGLIRKVFPDH